MSATHRFETCTKDRPIQIQSLPYGNNHYTLAGIFYNLPSSRELRGGMLQALMDTVTARAVQDSEDAPTQTFALPHRSVMFVAVTESFSTRGGLPTVGERAKAPPGRPSGFGEKWRDYVGPIREADRYIIYSIYVFCAPDVTPTVRQMFNISRQITYVRLLGCVLNLVGTRARMLQTLVVHKIQMVPPNVKALEVDKTKSGLEMVRTLQQTYSTLYRVVIQCSSGSMRLLLFGAFNKNLTISHATTPLFLI
jgi:hypothetical protein